MRYALSVILAAHGIAHLAGIRAIGVLWLLTAGLMVASAAGLALRARWAQARIGLAVNLGLVLLLLLHPAMGQAGPFTSASISCYPGISACDP